MNGLKIKHLALAAAAAVVTGTAAIGVVGAQTATPSPGVSEENQGRKAMHAEVIARAAAKLNIPADQLAQALRDAAKELRGERPAAEKPRGPRGHAGMALASFGRVAADAIGISPEVLRQELPGKSLADVARAKNVEPSRVVNALVADLSAKLDQAVADGRITAERAAAQKAKLTTRMSALVERQVPDRRGPPRDREGPRPTATPTAT